MKNSYIALTIILQMLCIQIIFCTAPSFSVRLGNQEDFAACKKISAEVLEKSYKILWQFNSEYDFINYCKELDESAFAPWSSFAKNNGVLFIAQDDKKNTIGYLQAFRFYQIDKTPETFNEFLTNTAQLDLSNDFKWLREKCDDSAIFISRIHIGQAWETKGVAKQLIELCASHFKSAQKVYFDVYTRGCGELEIYLISILTQVTTIFPGMPYESIIFSVDAAKMKALV